MAQLKAINLRRCNGLTIKANGNTLNDCKLTILLKRDKSYLKIYLQRYSHFMHELMMHIINSEIFFQDVNLAWLEY